MSDNSERLVTLDYRATPAQAEICRLRLEAEGIPCVLEETDGMAWLWGHIGRTKIKVPEKDLERARAILATPVVISEDEWQSAASAQTDESDASGAGGVGAVILRFLLPAAVVFSLIIMLLLLTTLRLRGR